MAKYYTVCAFTPASGSTARRDKSRAYLYRSAPHGFLFHDTENNLEVADIRLPIRYLAELFDGAKAALVVRVNAKTLALTFSFAGIPTPATRLSSVLHGRLPYKVTEESDEYRNLTRDLMPDAGTWVIPDVNDPKTAVTELPLSDLYDQCTQLMRHTGNCPCPLLSHGQCVKDNILPSMPEGFTTESITSFYEVDQRQLRRVRYVQLEAFKYVSGKATDSDDFATTFRPWDDYDFRNVEERTVELKARGIARHVRNQFKEEECKQCAYRTQYAHNANLYDACPSLRNCGGHVVDADAWTLLYDWLYKKSGYLSMPGFSDAERTYLIRHAGSVAMTNIHTPSRRTETVFGGFMLHGSTWKYRMVPGGGNLHRYTDFDNYTTLRIAVPELPIIPGTVEAIPAQTLLACAILGHHPYIYLSGKGSYLRRYVKLTSVGVETVGSNSRYTSGEDTLTRSSSVRKYTQRLWGYQFGTLAAEVRKLPGRSESAPDVSVQSMINRRKAVQDPTGGT